MKRYTKLFVILLLGMGAFFIVRLNDTGEEEDTTREKAKMEYVNRYLETNLFYFQSGEQKPLPDLEILYPRSESNDGDVLVSPSRKLILRMKAQHCNLCYEAEFRRLKEHLSKLGTKNILVLASFKKRQFRVLVKNFEKELPGVVFINTLDVLPFKQEEFNQPYYFILEPSGAVHSFFLPDKSLPEYSYEYFGSLDFD